MAYVGRYANQSRTEMRGWPLPVFRSWIKHLADIVRRENSTEEGPDA